MLPLERRPSAGLRARAADARPRGRLAVPARRLAGARGRAGRAAARARRRDPRRRRLVDELPRADVVLCDVVAAGAAAARRGRFPARYERALRRYRYGPGAFKLDWALDGPIPWRDERCARAGDGAPRRDARGDRRVGAGAWTAGTPERPFVLLAQQSLLDDTRAPAGRHTAWAYCHVPNGSTDDMTDGDRGAGRAFRARLPRPDPARSALGPARTRGARPQPRRRRHQRRRDGPAASSSRRPVAPLVPTGRRSRRLPLLRVDPARRRRPRHVRLRRGADRPARLATRLRLLAQR